MGNARRPYDGGPFGFEIDLLPYIIKAVPLLVRLSQGGFASRLCYIVCLPSEPLLRVGGGGRCLNSVSNIRRPSLRYTPPNDLEAGRPRTGLVGAEAEPLQAQKILPKRVESFCGGSCDDHELALLAARALENSSTSKRTPPRLG